MPLVLSIQDVINPRREVKGHGYTPLLRDRLSFVKRQFVEATGLTRAVESRWISSYAQSCTCPMRLVWRLLIRGTT